MKQINIQMYAFSETELPEYKKMELVSELGFDGVELLQEPDKRTVETLSRLGLHSPSCYSCHFQKGVIPMADTLHQLGVQYIGVSDIAPFGTRDQVLYTAETMNRMGEQAKKQGFKLYCHNHTHEWRKVSDDYLFDLLLDHTDPDLFCVEMDVGFAAAVGVDVKAFLARHPGRVELMHIKSTTKPMDTETVWFMAPDETGAIKIPPAGEPMPPELLRELTGTMNVIREASGPMNQCLADYASILPLAEQLGCKVFIVDRDQFYNEDQLLCLREDLCEVRRIFS